MKENLIKKERNAKETIALVTGMFANIQDSLKDDRVRYRIFEDSYDTKKVLYFQMLEKSEFVNYKVVEIQDKDIVTFKLFLQTYGDDKLICEHTITDRYKLSIKHQTDINISKETDIKSKEDKKEYQEDIFRIFRMFKKIDEYFMLGYFIGNGAVYPLFKKSPGEFLNLCDKVWRQISPIYPSQASVIGTDMTDMGTVLSEFHKLVDITLAKTISEVSSQSSDTFTSYIHLLRDTLTTKFPELSSDNITENLYLDTMSYRRLIEFAVDYVITQVDAMLTSCKDVKKLRENYIKLNNLFKITKQAAEQAEFNIYESESVDEKLKEVCDYIDKKSKTMTLLLEKFIETITHFNLNISDGKIKAEMDKSDDNFIEYTLKIFSDNMRKIQEDPTKDTFRKDIEMLMSLAECIVTANHENSKITGFTNDIPASIVSIRLRSIAQENKLKESKPDTVKKVEKTIEIEDEALTKRYDNLIYNVKEVMKIFKYQHDINTETYINYLSHADLIDFSTEVLYNLIDMNTKIEGKTKEKHLLDLAISIAGLVIVELKRKYSNIQNIDQTYKDAKTEQAAIKILKNAIINFENKVKTSLFDKQVIQQDSYSNLISFDKQELLQQDSYLNLISSAISLYDHICSKQTPLSILNYAYFSYDDLDTIADFSRLIDTCISSVEYIYTTTDEKDAAKTLGRKFDSITKFFEFDNYDDPGYPVDGDDKKIIKFLLNQATTLNPLLSSYIESCKEDGIDTDSCSIMSVILEDFLKYTLGTYYYDETGKLLFEENEEDIKMNKEKDIFAPIDWEKELTKSPAKDKEKDIFAPIDWEKKFEKSSEELLKRAYCCKELKPTSLYPSYVNVIERLNCYDEHLMMLQPLDAKMPATKVIAHIVAHMSNAPISKDIVVESFVDQFCNINVNIYDNSGESPKTLVTRTYAHDEYTVTELGCGYAVGIYSMKYNKNESKDYYIPYKKKC